MTYPLKVFKEVTDRIIAEGGEIVTAQPALKAFKVFVVDNKLENLSFHGQRVEYRRYVNGGKW